MHTLGRNITTFALCLAALAGCVDAIGFLKLGGYFVSFMSGNSTELAVGLIQGDWHRAGLAAVIIALFVIGAGLGMVVSQLAKPQRQAVTVLSLVTLLLGFAAAYASLGMATQAMMLVALAMGVENATLRGDDDATIGVTYMTGTLTKVGQRLANALLGKEESSWLPYLLLWLGLITGGAIGTMLFMKFGLYSLWIAAVWAGILTVVAGRIEKA